MYVDINYLENLKFNNCENCSECCKNKYLAPLILDDFKKVYEYFPIFIAKLETFKPVMLLSNETQCPYLINEKCSIYEKRPPACRLYPYSPWFNKILIDLSCKGVGIKGENLPLTITDFKNSSFFDERVINIENKIFKTYKWLENKKLYPFAIYYGIELFDIKDKNDEYDEMVIKSKNNLVNYCNINCN
jgi:Fe-S-cluster containining protein